MKDTILDLIAFDMSLDVVEPIFVTKLLFDDEVAQYIAYKDGKMYLYGRELVMYE